MLSAYQEIINNVGAVYNYNLENVKFTKGKRVAFTGALHCFLGKTEIYYLWFIHR